MSYQIGLIRGDGIGPEIIEQAVKVLDQAAEKFGLSFSYTDILLGGASIDATGKPLTDEAIETAKSCHAVLMGSIGGDAATSPWYKLPANLRQEAGLLGIRKALGLFANLRPAFLYKELKYNKYYNTYKDCNYSYALNSQLSVSKSKSFPLYHR